MPGILGGFFDTWSVERKEKVKLLTGKRSLEAPAARHTPPAQIGSISSLYLLFPPSPSWWPTLIPSLPRYQPRDTRPGALAVRTYGPLLRITSPAYNKTRGIIKQAPYMEIQSAKYSNKSVGWEYMCLFVNA